uniref:Actin-related protein 2/3 complex subunit 5 n=1 Tax=Panagrellus redivivus TaxID=6233 RepID=A0A7E4VTN3_PANRE
MAKNTNDTSFRKINVDTIDSASGAPLEYEDVAGPNEATLQSLVSTKRYADVLKELARTIPLRSKNQQVKDQAAEIATRILGKFNKEAIASGLDGISGLESEAILHYVFRGFEIATENGTINALLAFHNGIFDKCGNGGVSRVVWSIYRLGPSQASSA